MKSLNQAGFTFNILNIIYGISCATLMVLISPVTEFFQMLFIATGMLMGIFEAYFIKRVRSNKAISIISIFATVAILYQIGKYFFILHKPSLMSNITSRISSNPDQVLIVISIMLAIVAFPALVFFVKLILIPVVKFVQLFKMFSMRYILCDWKTFGKSIVIVALNIFIAIICGIVLLIGAYSLPLENIEYNVQQSADAIKNEGSYLSVFSWCNSQLDNYTDSIMLLEAADNTDASPIENAIMANFGIIQGYNPYETLISHYVSGVEFTSKAEYSRYWHGHQIILKPLLEMLNYSGIRILNLILQILLIGIIGLLLYRCDMFCYFPAYLIAYLMLMPIVLGKSLQFSSCYYVFSLGVIVLLLMDKSRKKYAYIVFVNIGIFTAFFDLLTYPMATFGIPALIYLALERKTETGKKIGNLIKNGAAWCIGYGGMWTSKWLVSSILIGHNILSEVIMAFSFHSSTLDTTGEPISRFVCEIRNYSTFMSTPMLLIFAIAVIYLVWKIYSDKGKVAKADCISILLPYFLLAFAPVVWYAFATNHSTIHCWFTNKSCVISFLAMLFCLVEIKNKNVESH